MTFTITMDIDERHWDETSDAYLVNVLAPAMSDALNAVAEAARVALGKATDTYFDRPVPFTENAFRMFHAYPGPEPEAGVFVLPLQAEYLELEIFGGVRRAGDYATLPEGVLVPARDTPLDSYGNIPRNFVASQEADPRVSWAILGPAQDETLIRHNEDGSTSFLARIVPEAHIDRRFPFYEIVEQVVLGMLPAAFAEALASQ